MDKQRLKCYEPLFLVIFFSVFLTTDPVYATSPFLVNTPQPEKYLHLDTYIVANSFTSNFFTLIQAPTAQLYYGAGPDFDLDLYVPYAFFIPNKESYGERAQGWGDVQVGFTYRFLTETDNRPQVGFTPSYSIATGNADKQLGNGRSTLTLPIWAQKSWDDWIVDGGGGYVLNSEPFTHNYWFGGILVQRKMFKKLTLGAEFFSQGAITPDIKSSTLFNAGGIYDVTKHFSVIFSAGHSVIGTNIFITSAGVIFSC